MGDIRRKVMEGGKRANCEDEAQEFIDLIDDMLLDDFYCYAEDTLTGIREWIEEARFITDKQKRAVINIYESKPD